MKKLWLGAAAVCSVIALVGCGSSKDVVAKESPLTEINNEYENYAQIYSSDFQKQVRSQLDEKKKEQHDFSSPLVAANPYRTNTTGLYLYFTTKEKAQIQYTVSAEGYADFTRTLYNEGENNLTTEHEYMLIGCVPGVTNTICLTAEDENGKKLGSYTFTYDAPNLLNSLGAVQAEIEKGESQEKLADGLYTVLGNDSSEESMEEDYVGIYDNDGVVRAEIPIINFRSHEMIFNETGMYYSISNRQMACLDRTGEVTRVYSMGDFTLHHDYVFGTENDLIILASRVGAETKDDSIVSMNLETGEVTEVVNLGDLFPDYLASSVKPEGAEVLDWMHLNSLALVDGDDLIVSARETSTIIYIEDIYDTPKVRYMIGSDNFWAGSGYEELLLTPKGDFSLQGGQHSVLYVPDDSLKEGQYYLEMFNNNNTYSLARKEYDWLADENYHDTGIAVDSKGNPSYYYKYLVDENAKTFELVDSLPVDYSGFVSSVQRKDGNLIVDSGGALAVAEFDQKNQLIQKLKFTGEKWIYRIKKYEYTNYWFYGE